MVATDRFVDLNGVMLHYREAGDPDAPTLVLLHALGADAASWNGVLSPLAASHRALALDLRGHGQSDRPGDYSFELMRGDLVAFLDALRLDRCSLIGHSMGGTVSWLFAEAWPDRLNSLVIEDTPPPSGRLPAIPDPPAEPPDPVPFDWRVIAPIVRQLNEPDPRWWDDLGRVSAPTLVVSGGSTSFIPQAALEEVARCLPNGRLVTIEGAGHRVHVERPDDFLKVVSRFLDSVH